jgi:pimeloyl-ACP methyl ester carboxylesterase
MVIGADKDLSYSIESIVQLADNIVGAGLSFLSGCAHNAQLEKPVIFNSIISDFLKPNTE